MDRDLALLLNRLARYLNPTNLNIHTEKISQVRTKIETKSATEAVSNLTKEKKS